MPYLCASHARNILRVLQIDAAVCGRSQLHQLENLAVPTGGQPLGSDTHRRRGHPSIQAPWGIPTFPKRGVAYGP